MTEPTLEEDLKRLAELEDAVFAARRAVELHRHTLVARHHPHRIGDVVEIDPTRRGQTHCFIKVHHRDLIDLGGLRFYSEGNVRRKDGGPGLRKGSWAGPRVGPDPVVPKGRKDDD